MLLIKLTILHLPVLLRRQEEMRLQEELQRREEELRHKEELFRQQQNELNRHWQDDMYLQVVFSLT